MMTMKDADVRVDHETVFLSLGRETWGLAKAQDEEWKCNGAEMFMFRSITEPEDDEVEVLHVTDCLIKADQPG